MFRRRSLTNGSALTPVRQTLNGPNWDPILDHRLRSKVDAVLNILSSRKDWFNQTNDPRRSIDDECGYPKTHSFTPWRYQTLYDRDAIAGAVIEAMPKEAWQVTPTVYEKEQGKVVTAFERSWDQLGQQLRSGGLADFFSEEEGSPVWEALMRANILSGIGQFGVLLFGFDDGLALNQPVAGVEELGSKPVQIEQMQDSEGNAKPFSVIKAPLVNKSDCRWSLTVNDPLTQGRRLGYLNAYPEAMVLPVRFESNKRSPRWGQTVMYQITFNDPSQQYQGIGLPLATEYVHWTRVLHVVDTVDTAGSSKVFGVQRCRTVLNNLLALQKIYHGGAEGYWKAVFSYLFLETHPQLGGDVDMDVDSLMDMMEEMMNGLQRYGVTAGMSAKAVGPTVADPTSQINVHLEAICIKKRMPMRIFKGSERGELASSQDDAAWNDRVMQYQAGYLTPCLIRPFVNRLVTYGVLPRPEHSSGLKCSWPDITSMSAQEKATVASTRMSAISQYVNGGGGNVLGLFDFLTREMGYDESEAKAIIDNVYGAAEDEGVQPEYLDEDVIGQDPVEEFEMPPAEDGQDQGQQSPMTGNTWSEASRIAAAEARRAAKTVRLSDKVVKRHTNLARDASLSAERKSGAAVTKLEHEGASQAHQDAARMHGSAAITQEHGGNREGSEAHLKAQEAHKKAAEAHIQHATTLNCGGEGGTPGPCAHPSIVTLRGMHESGPASMTYEGIDQHVKGLGQLKEKDLREAVPHVFSQDPKLAQGILGTRGKSSLLKQIRSAFEGRLESHQRTQFRTNKRRKR